MQSDVSVLKRYILFNVAYLSMSDEHESLKNSLVGTVKEGFCSFQHKYHRRIDPPVVVLFFLVNPNSVVNKHTVKIATYCNFLLATTIDNVVKNCE